MEERVAPRVVPFPPAGGGYRALTVVGALLALAGGYGLSRDLGHIAPEVLAYLALGSGVFVAFFGLIGTTKAPPAHLELAATGLRLVERSGEAVDVPWGVIASVEVVETQQSGSHHTVALRRRDGGIIELGSYPGRERALAISEPIAAALADADATESDETLTAMSAVETTRDGDRLVLTWRAGAPASRLLALGPIGGMAIIALGFQHGTPGLGPLLVAAAMGTLGLALLASWLWTLGNRQRIAIDRRALVVERLRGGRVVDEKEVPIVSVVTVDYSDRLNVHGESLTIRTGAAAAKHGAIIEATSSAESDTPEIALGMMKLVGTGITVPVGSLSRACCIALELAVSAEVARRSRRPSGTV